MSNYDEIFEKNFDKIRSQQAYVEEEDASRKSSIDSRIVELVNAINKSDNYFTTSSCSGRFIAYAQVYFYSMIENSIFQIYSFMVGNLQANDMGLDHLTGPNLVTFGIFIIFLFLIPSLAFNIFTGIAINEIQSLIKDCNIQILKDKIDYIYDGDHSIFKWHSKW